MGYKDKKVSRSAKKLRISVVVLACLLTLCLWAIVIWGSMEGKLKDALELTEQQGVIYFAGACAVIFSVILLWLLKVESGREVSED